MQQRLVRLLRASAPALAAVIAPLYASAHPGHDHADIPSVIRHPMAGPEHVVVTIVVIGTLALAACALARRLRKRPRKS